MREDYHDDFEELLRSTRRRSRARNRDEIYRSRALAVLAPLLTLLVALAMYGDWETPHDRRTPTDDVASWRASPLPSNPAALPVLVQRDIEQLVAVDRTDVPARAARDGTALRTERRVTLLRAYAVLRYDEAGPLLEDVVDTATDERVRAEAVTMLGYVGYPSWRLLDELVDTRDAGRDLMPHLRALRYFFAMASDPPPWIRDVVRELVAIAEECPRIECRRAAASAFSRATRMDLESDWIAEVERLLRNDDHECRVRAIDSIRGATARLHAERSAEILLRSLASDHESEVMTAITRVSSLPHNVARRVALPSIRNLAVDPTRSVDVRSSSQRAARAIDAGVDRDPPMRSAVGVVSPDDEGLRALLISVFELRRNTSKSIVDVVQEGRREFAVDPLRRIAREIRREVME